MTPSATTDPQVEEAYEFMTKAANALSTKDESTVFGEMLALKLRKLTPRNRTIAQYKITNLIFEMEMEDLTNAPTSGSLPSPVVSYSYTQSLSPAGSLGNSGHQSPTPPTEPIILYMNNEESVGTFKELFNSIQDTDN